ncbi:hypothetical protein MTR_6g464020 [Medicago truncatula]|uniref:Uncharacterized protein n=1 Tax=Medicago truncatula TaxID=3880 RepID=A0A072UL08_MEDTR|nr:hypothetical protein MTR_6g464020 [Medicago truncatula]
MRACVVAHEAVENDASCGGELSLGTWAFLVAPPVRVLASFYPVYEELPQKYLRTFEMNFLYLALPSKTF